MRENLPNGCESETKNGNKLGCKNRNRRRNNIDTVDADPDNQNGNQETERGVHGVGGLARGSENIVSPLTRLIRGFRDNNH